MRTFPLAVLSMMAASSAVMAKPLPKTMKVHLKIGSPMVTLDGTTVPLTEDLYADWDAVKAELSEDGKAITFSGKRCNGAVPPEASTGSIPLTKIEAKVDNTAGMALHKKKKYADAAKRFASAVAKDPDTALYATNLLAAQVKAGKLGDADQTLASAGKRNVPWFAWRLQVDPELKPLKNRPSTAMFATKAPGKARSVALADAIASSPLGLVATKTSSGDGGPGSSAPNALSIADIATGKELLRLPMLKKPDIAVGDALLITLGFVYEGGLVDVRMKKSYAGQEGRALYITGDKVEVRAPTGSKSMNLPNLVSIAFVPAGLGLLQRQEHLYRCDDTSFRTVLLAMPNP